MGQYWQSLQITVKLMSNRFQGQTNVGAFDVGLNILSKARPIIFLVNKLPDFIDTKIAYQRVVVIPANKLCLNDFRYKQ